MRQRRRTTTTMCSCRTRLTLCRWTRQTRRETGTAPVLDHKPVQDFTQQQTHIIIAEPQQPQGGVVLLLKDMKTQKVWEDQVAGDQQ